MTRMQATPPKLTTQLLVINLDRERFEFLSQGVSPCPNIFYTRSPDKALLWSRLEALDLIIMRFGEPLASSMDLLQALIEANPAPPILLLAEPGAERVAERLVQHNICLMQPITAAPASLQQLVHRLLALPERQTGARSPGLRPAAAAPSLPAGTAPAPAPPAAGHPARPASPDWEFPFLDQLVIELAHRLKNPLVSIKTFTHLLRERFADPEFRERFYTIVGNDVVQLNDVVDRLLEFTEFARPYPKPLRLDEEVAQAVDIVEPALQAKQLAVQTEFQSAAPNGSREAHQLVADPMQFRYLLKQILLDSAAASPAGGQLHLAVEMNQADGDRAAVTLRLESAAGPLATGRPHEWPSLELLLAKNLIERQHGTITVAMTPTPDGGRRRRVIVTLPLTTAGGHHDGLPPPAKRQAVLTAGEPAATDRRRIPLSIAFRERRQSARRQQNVDIGFTDRRRFSGGFSLPPGPLASPM
jgi:hypothetical protein